MTKFILLACMASTLSMTGLIWFVHIVHYPLFDRVGPSEFRRYHADHARLTGYVVMGPMVLELLTSGILAGRPPDGTWPWLAWLGFAMAVATWAVTGFYSVPMHNRLAICYEPEPHRWLVTTNGLRVLAWTGHSAVVLVMTARALR